MNRPIKSRNDMVHIGKAAKEGWSIDPNIKADVVEQLRTILSERQGNARFQKRAESTLEACLEAGWALS